MLLLIFVSLLICGNFEFSMGQCGTCGTGNVACLSRNTFQLCIGNKPMPSMGTHTCDDGLVCVSTNQARCLPTSAGSVASCGPNCGICNAGSFVSCTDQKNFTLCTGNMPGNSVGECPDNYVCNSASNEFCILETAVEGSTCPPPPPTEEPPTGGPPNQPSNPTEFCAAQKNVRFPKRFPLPGDCTKFISCSIATGNVFGKAYRCPGTQKFNCQTEVCGPICVPCQ